jgi:DNA modification methylase
MKNPQQLTNEEQRVVYYASVQEPTIPSSVTPDTDLSTLNLNWSERELPERERTKHVHRLHPYLGKFIPQLVEVFLRKYFMPGQTIVDPFVGSGTALVQANELGINAIGYDVSAFNILLAKAKTDYYDRKLVKKEILDALHRFEDITRLDAQQLSLWDVYPEEELSVNNKYLINWFATQSLSELIAYRDLIPNYQYQDLLKVILSRSARSARLTTHFDLDFPKKPINEPYWCYKHSRTCMPTSSAHQFIRRYSLDTIRRIEEFSTKRTNAKVSINHEDSRFAQIPSVDGLITSPPYVGLIDYHEQHRYAYELLELRDHRIAEIGPAERGSSQKAQREYQEAITQVFHRAMPSICRGGHLIVVVGDRYGLYNHIAEQLNVEVEAIIRRHVNRRTGRRSSEFFEDVLIWRKND